MPKRTNLALPLLVTVLAGCASTGAPEMLQDNSLPEWQQCMRRSSASDAKAVSVFVGVGRTHLKATQMAKAEVLQAYCGHLRRRDSQGDCEARLKPLLEARPPRQMDDGLFCASVTVSQEDEAEVSPNIPPAEIAWRPVGYGVVAAGLVSVGTGVYWTLEAKDHRAALKADEGAASSPALAQAYQDNINTAKTRANIFYAVGAAVVGVGVGLAIWDTPYEPQLNVAAGPDEGLLMVTLPWR